MHCLNQNGLVKMKRNPKIPKFKEKVFIICEGIGDKIYLDRIFSFYESKYDIRVIQSNGKQNIVDKLKDVLIFNPYNEWFIFMDTDVNVKKNIEELECLLDSEEINYKDRLFFVNPIIEYLYLTSKVDKHPTSYYTKNKYSRIFAKEFGLKEYRGTQKQYEQLASQINHDDFEKLILNVKTDISQCPSSTIISLIDRIIKK